MIRRLISGTVLAAAACSGAELQRAGPAQTAESGIMWARFSVETGG